MAVGITHAVNSTCAATAARVVADGTTTTTITVTCKDSAGDDVGAGHSITLTASAAGVTIATSPGTTDSDGIATFTVKSSTVGPAITFTARDTTDEVTIVQTAAVTFFGMSISLSTVATSAARVVANNSTTATITVTVKDDSDTAMGTCAVVVSAVGTPAGVTVTGGSGNTDGSGVFTCTVKSTTPYYGATPVVIKAVASFQAIEITQRATITFYENATASVSVSTCTTSAASVFANNTATATITGTLLTAAGAAVKGHVVTLTAANGTGVTITTSPGETDANGQCTFVVKSTTVHGGSNKTTFTLADTDVAATITQTAEVYFYGTLTANKSEMGFSSDYTRPFHNILEDQSITVTSYPAGVTSGTITNTGSLTWIDVGATWDSGVANTVGITTANLHNFTMGLPIRKTGSLVFSKEGYVSLTVPITLEMKGT